MRPPPTRYSIAIDGAPLAVNIQTDHVGGMVNAYIEANAPTPVTITVTPQP